MSIDFEEILLELSYRSPEGIVDLTKEHQVKELANIFKEYHISDANRLAKETSERYKRLKLETDAREKEVADQAEKMGLVSFGFGNYGKPGTDKATHRVDDNGKLVPIASGDTDTQPAPTEKPKEEPKKSKETDKGGEAQPPSQPAGKIPPEGFVSSAEKNKEVKQKSKADAQSEKEKIAQSEEKLFANSYKVAQSIYGNEGKGNLLSSEVSTQALQSGYVKGASYVAPGNAGSAFNENMSNEGAMILEKLPNLSVEELTAVMFIRSANTKLGKEQKGTVVEGGDQPVKVPKLASKNPDLWRACVIAARAAKEKRHVMEEGTSAAQSQVQFGTETKQTTYGGTAIDLNNLANKIQNAKNCYIYDAGTDKVYHIPTDTLVNWVKASGGGKNASDTSFVVEDKNGNLIYNGFSDKKAFSDIQGNSTLSDDYAKSFKTVSNLQKTGMIDENTYKSAKKIIIESQQKTKEIEANYENAVYKEGQYLSQSSDETKKRCVELLTAQSDSYNSAKTTNHVENILKVLRSKNPNATHEDVLNFLFKGSQTNKLTADQRKVLNRMADEIRSDYTKKGQPIPDGLNTSQILSDARNSALNLQRETVDNLNRLVGRTTSGNEKKLGDLLGFHETVDFLHLDKIDEPKSNSDYDQILMRNTNLVMAGVVVPANTIKHCLGVSDLNDYEDNFKVITDERVILDREEGKYVTGKIVLIYAVSKEGKTLFIGEKRYRSKQGATGKTSNTIQWSPEMQNCFNKNRRKP